MNPLLSIIHGNQNRQNGNGGNNMLAAAMAAMMSGKSPQEFLSTIPELQGMDISNPIALSQMLCKSRGIDYEQAKSSVYNTVTNMQKS